MSLSTTAVQRKHPGRKPSVAVAVALLAASTLMSAPPASSTTFPGLNGKIAFQSLRDGNNEIYTINPNGTSPVNLTNNPAQDTEPRWSPDGTRILFVSDRDGDQDVYVMNADGSGVTQITDNAGIDRMPAWAPTGTQLVWVRQTGGTAFDLDLLKMNLNGTGVVQLTSASGRDWNPAWSPDGTRISFQTERDANFEIYAMAADGTNQTNLTNHPDFDGAPHWSPNSQKIVFSSNRIDGVTGDIFVMNADGSSQTLVSVSTNAADNRAVFSPDGDRIIFSSNRLDGDFELYTISKDGINDPDYRLVRTTRSAGFDQSPDWQSLSQPPPPPTGADVVADTPAGGDAVTTDATTGGPTVNDIIETTVTVPSERAVSISETSQTSQPQQEWTVIGGDIDITAPPATSGSPMRFFFAIDSSQVPQGWGPQEIAVFRNGTEVAPCSGPGGVAAPDPCIGRVGQVLSGDLFVAVLTSAASTWDVGLRPPRQVVEPPQPSSSSTPIATATTTPTPSPTPTTTPSGSPSPSVTTTSSPSVPAADGRSVTLETSTTKAEFGGPVTLSGAITSATSTCVAFQSIVVSRTVAGSSTQATFAELVSTAEGTFTTTFEADVGAAYVASASATPQCESATSAAKVVLVKVDVGLTPSGRRVDAGERVRLDVSVAPCGDHAGTEIRLKKRTDGDFESAGSATLDDRCEATFRKTVRRTTDFKAKWKKQDDEHETGKSEVKTVRAA